MKLHQTKHGSSKRNAASLLYSKLKRTSKSYRLVCLFKLFVKLGFWASIFTIQQWWIKSSSHFIDFEFNCRVRVWLSQRVQSYKVKHQRIATYFEAKIKTTFMTTLVRSVLEKKVQKIKEGQAEEERQIEIHFISHFDLVDFQYFPVLELTKVGFDKIIFLIENATIFHAKTNSLTIVKIF